MSIFIALLIARALSASLSLFAIRQAVTARRVALVIAATLFAPLLTPLVLCIAVPLVRMAKNRAAMNSLPKDAATLEIGEVNRVADNNVAKVKAKAQENMKLFSKMDDILGNIEADRAKMIAEVGEKYGVEVTPKMSAYVAPENYREAGSMYAERKIQASRAARQGENPQSASATLLASRQNAARRTASRRPAMSIK